MGQCGRKEALYCLVFAQGDDAPPGRARARERETEREIEGPSLAKHDEGKRYVTWKDKVEDAASKRGVCSSRYIRTSQAQVARLD